MLAEIPVFILCGGLGTRLKEETEYRPKPMVPIGPYPILWHIMRSYSHYGFRRFILCLGFKAEVIKSYFLNYYSLNSDFTVDLATNEVNVHLNHHQEDWEVTLAYTGETAMTGSRIARAAERYLGDADHFAVTYGDGVTDADLAEEYRFFLDRGKIGTLLGVDPPSRFGEIQMRGDQVSAFAEKSASSNSWINGGYFFFRREFLNYLSPDDACVLEQQPLVKLARDGELAAYRHKGFWACMDTLRDQKQLGELWSSGDAPWARPWLPSASFRELVPI